MNPWGEWFLEKDEIGASFKKWPEESCFISPSFIGNFFNMPDLNSIAPATSPAFNLLTEHPNGQEFANVLATYWQNINKISARC